MQVKWRSKLTVPAVEGIALFCAVCIALVLLIAGMGKMLHPVEALESFDQIVSVLEFILLGMVLYFRNHFLTWMLCACIFSSWGGYAAFWYFLELPCSCMGTALQIPTILTLLMDVLFFSVSLCVASFLGAKRDILYSAFLVCLFLSLAGFAFAEQIYRYFILNV